jgi:hypothetical protein
VDRHRQVGGLARPPASLIQAIRFNCGDDLAETKSIGLLLLLRSQTSDDAAEFCEELGAVNDP